MRSPDMQAVIAYRPDIDGLRALAVLAVVFYHAFPAVVPGGYVGVDVFFVISGYLIAGILLRELQAGSFSFRAFWMRRVRRLFPAAAVVFAAATLAFSNVLNPAALVDYGRSLLAQLAFASNVYFWTKSSYFDITATLKPLLHTWSLSVEEQFYMFFPLLLWAVYRYCRSRLVFLVVTATLVSLLLSIWGTEHFESAAFYLLPFRAWELGIGVALAAIALERPGSFHVAARHDQLLCGLGFTAIAASVLLFDDFTPFPSYTALVPTVGTALVILAGHGSSIVGGVLRNPLIVFVGKISYSLYLWHWVVLTYVRNTVLGTPSSAQLAACIAVSVAMAVLTYLLVELPTRRNRSLFTNARILAFSGSVAISLISAALVIRASDGFAGRLKLPESEFARSTRSECLNPRPQAPVFCEIGDPTAPISFVAIGDSHSYALLPAYEQLAGERGLRGLFAAGMGCLPLLAVHPVRERREVLRCSRIVEETMALLESGQVRDLVLAVRWAFYYSDESPDRIHQPIVMDGQSNPSIKTSQSIYRRQLRATLQRLGELGVRVYVVDQIPHQYLDPRDALIRAGRLDVDPNTLTLTRHDHLKLQAPIDELFSPYEELTHVSVDDWLCGERCRMFSDAGEPLYSDDDHLSSRGAKFVAPALAPLFDRLRHDLPGHSRRK